MFIFYIPIHGFISDSTRSLSYGIWVDIQKNGKNEKIQFFGEFIKQEIVHYIGSSPVLLSGNALCNFVAIVRFLLFTFLNNLTDADPLI